MVSGGGSQCDSEQPIEFPHEFCHKLRTSVQDYFPWETMVVPHVLKVELSSPSSRESGHCVDEVSTLGDGVYHGHDGIVTS